MYAWVKEPFSKWRGTSARQKNYIKFLWFELATVTSQALKYDVITYTASEGLNCTILVKLTPLWKRIGELPEIQIGCYRATQVNSVTRAQHTIYSDWLNKTVRRFRHWNFHLLSFWLALLLLCDVGNNKWEVLMIISPLLSNIRHRAMITPVSLLTRLIQISPCCWTIYRSFKIILDMGTVHWIELQIQCSIQIHCFKKHSVWYELCFKTYLTA